MKSDTIADKKNRHTEPLKKFLSFLKFYLPLFCVAMFFFIWRYHTSVNNRINIIKSEAHHLNDMGTQYIKGHFKLIIGDINYLSQQFHILQRNIYTIRQHHFILKKMFKNFLKKHNYYFQLRIINQFGKEEIRLERLNGKVAATLENKLQNKKRRYYFQESIKLPGGKYFISPFDLNIEHGKIEKPFKPTIRFAAPLFTPTGQRRGVIILNYLGNVLLNNLKNIHKNLHHHHQNTFSQLLYNKRGYIFLGQKPWGFILKNGRPTTIHPLMSGNKNNSYEDKQALYLYKEFRPFLLKHAVFLHPDDYKWKLCTIIYKKNLQKIKSELFTSQLGFYLPIILILFPIAFILLHLSNQKKNAEERLKKLANTDQLTGLLNRRAFLKLLHQEQRRAIRYRNLLTIIMIDIDHFKDLNDTFGHDGGDRILSEISILFTKHLREMDWICRWGGEEFIIILPETKFENGKKVAEKLHSLVETTPFSYAGTKMCITISAGVCSYDNFKSINDNIKRVDQLLYHAKSNGRNRVEFM